MAKLTKTTLFKPKGANSKQAMTDSIAREIIDAEAAARRAKTEKLRKLRLAKSPDNEDDDSDAGRSKSTERRGRSTGRPDSN